MSDQLVFIYTQGLCFVLVGDPGDVFQQLSLCNEVGAQAVPLPRRRFRRRVSPVPLVAGRVLRVGPGFAISYQQSANDNDPKPAVLRPVDGPASPARVQTGGDLSALCTAHAAPVRLAEVHTTDRPPALEFEI